jgi:hypothetical protein
MSKIIIFFLIILTSSCGLYRPRFIKTETGRQAVKEAYRLNNKNNINNVLIDTSAIYLTQHDYLITNRRGSIIEPEHTYYNFIRFSNNGTAYIRSLMLDIPSEFDFNNLEKGQFCFYILEKDIVKLEVYNFDTKMFEYRYGRIQKNGDILFFKNKGRPWWAYKGKLNDLYRKTPANIKTKLVFPE